MNDLFLAVENLALEFATPFGRVPALCGISFQLEQGEILGLVGESGSGKTMACRSILGLLPHNARITSGRVLYSGRDILALPKAERTSYRGRKMAMIFQNPSTHLDPLMTVGRQIGEALKVHFKVPARERRAQAIELLQAVRIPNPEHWVDSYPHQLSGGMKQRVMIAAALACQPEVLIADEPTTALDVTVQAGILKLLKQLREERALSIILVSHDLGVIAETCDRVVVMKDGLVVEKGSVHQILTGPQDPYTQQLIASHPALQFGAGEEEERAGPELAPPVLELKNFSVTFGEQRGPIASILFGDGPSLVRAVRDVSFKVEAGETLGIVGESGSGKSTVARSIVRLTTPAAGKILYKGKSLAEMDRAEYAAYRRAVQIVFQEPFNSLNPRMSVAQTLSEPLRRHRLCPREEIDDRVAELMASVELPLSLRNRRPHELSGGQCQRVGIARALTMSPEVLVADEITSALDVTIQAQILELLEKLREQMNLTIIFISHDLGVVQKICHNVVVMQNGQLVEYGTTGQILEQPRKTYTRELLSAVPRMPGDGLPGAETSPSSHESLTLKGSTTNRGRDT